MKTDQTAIKSVDNPYFNYWQAVYLSFYSPQLYVDVGKRWKGMGLKYLLFLLLLLMIPLAIRMTFDFNTYNENYIKPLEKTPVFYIQNGKVEFDKPMPYFIKNALNQVVVIIDTTGKITTMGPDYPYLSLLVTSNRIYNRSIPVDIFFMQSKPTQGDEMTVIEIPPNINEVIDTEHWSKGVSFKMLKTLIYLSIYPILLGIFFGMYSTLLFAFSFMGQIIAGTILKYTLTFAQAFRLISVSATPHLIIFLFGLTFDATGIAFNAIVFLFIFVYFSFGVLAMRRVGKRLVHY